MRGQRHQRIADFVGEMLGHGFHQAEIRSLDLQPLRALVLRDVFDDEERSRGTGGTGGTTGTN